jgi:hypothetical protein
MNDKEIEAMANKVADILWSRYEERMSEHAEMMAEAFLDAPFKTRANYEKELKGKTGRQILNSISLENNNAL